MKKISIVTGTYNEAENINEFYDRCKAVLNAHPEYDYEFIVADNCSTDETPLKLSEIAKEDHKFKVIFNSSNFGFLRSQFNALIQAAGDAVVFIFSDLQDPPEFIHELIRKWEDGYEIICATKGKTKEGFLLSGVRKMYYRTLSMMSDVKLINDYYGFGLYDKKVVEAFRQFHENYPYLRGQAAEVGFKRILVPYIQEKRKQGKSSFNFSRLYDTAMLGFINYTKLPIRILVFTGFILAIFSFIIAIVTFVLKFMNINYFATGIAAIVVGIFFFFGIILLSLGIIGEYVMAILYQVKRQPLVIEARKINFDKE